MALDLEIGRLRRRIQTMYVERIVNAQFIQLQTLKIAAGRPDFVLREVTLYCAAVPNLFSLMSHQIYQDDVDFFQLELHALDLYNRKLQYSGPEPGVGLIIGGYLTYSIGAELVKLACDDIVQGCQEFDKDQGAIIWAGWHKSACRSNLTGFLKEMALHIRKQILQGYLTHVMFSEGFVNDHFSQILALKSANNPYRVLQMIDVYCFEMETILSELGSCIDLPDVDFSMLVSQARKAAAESSCIGAEHMRCVCRILIRACEQKHRGNVSQAISWLKNEFSCTRKKFETFAQMERKIIELEIEQKNGD